MVCTLLAISFLEYRNNHTCLPISGSFAKPPRNLTHSRLPENSFCQRFQHFGYDFIFTSSFSRFYSFNCRSTSAAVKTSSSPKFVTSCVSRVDAFTGFKRSSKYSLYRERILCSSVRMLFGESLMDYVTLDLLPRKRRMVCQNTSFADKIVGIQPTTELFP